ncbi:NADPH-dependent FMN reductase [Furfurilactobacillus sp. WILCCON 0119]|uniref:NADPH-dependent FMN reductase n=1 Tax=Furfurilactobacillus entadae TaxID=2922307 RepID=UPI0035E8002C
MPRFIAIVGTNASKSYNRVLLNYMKSHFADQAEIEVQEIKDVPLFNEDAMTDIPTVIENIDQKILAADGVIFGVPEYDHSVPACLKSLIEWLSSARHSFNHKPVMIVGGSYGIQGTVRAQMNLRQILDSPGVNAEVLPGNEFQLANVTQKLDDNGQLVDERSAQFLDTCFDNFVDFVRAHEIVSEEKLVK